VGSLPGRGTCPGPRPISFFRKYYVVRNSYMNDKMSGVEMTRISSKGQIVIPSSIRQDLGLNTGDHLVVFTDGEIIFMRKVDRDKIISDFTRLSLFMSKLAIEKDIGPLEVEEAVDEVRHGKKSDG
jgi:AbrB family looped-hinge helix DNA binding protein